MLSTPSETKHDLNFSVASVPVRVNPFFWLMAIFLGWHEAIRPDELATWIVCVFISILVHELGHAKASKYFSQASTHIILHGMGGLTLSKASLNRRERIILLLSGPGAGFILFLLAWLILKLVPNEWFHPLLFVFLMDLTYINLVWGLLNLLPIFPLDGGQILSVLIKTKRPWESAELTCKASAIIATVFALLFLILAIIDSLRKESVDWFPIVAFACLAAANYQWMKMGGIDHGGWEGEEPRKSWEKDPDWWKR